MLDVQTSLAPPDASVAHQPLSASLVAPATGPGLTAATLIFPVPASTVLDVPASPAATLAQAAPPTGLEQAILEWSGHSY